MRSHVAVSARCLLWGAFFCLVAFAAGIGWLVSWLRGAP